MKSQFALQILISLIILVLGLIESRVKGAIMV